jgi:hypothetical protein
MALTTYGFAKSVALTDYMPPFRQAKEQVTWAWDKIVSKKKTSRATEQVFSYTGLPAANQTGELEPIYYADANELGAVTFTVTKKTLATMFSHEFLQDSWHLPDMMKEAGKMAGESQAYIRDLAVAAILYGAFDTTTTYEGSSTYLCDSHTMKNGGTYDNDLGPSSITFDNLWLMINHFETAPVTHQGLYLKDTPKYLIYHPSKEKEVRAVLRSDWKPGTGDNDYNSVQDYNLIPVPCRFLTTTTHWFIAGSRFKQDFCFFEREGVKTAMEDDFDRMGVKFRSYQRFAVGVRDFLWIVGNPGA